MSDRSPLKSVETTFEVVEALTELDRCGVSELSDHLGMPTSTLHEYLRTLDEKGYVVNNDGEYHLSSRFLSIGVKVRNNKQIFTIAKPELQSLADKTGAHVSLMTEENEFGIVLYIDNMSHRMRPVSHTGMATYLHVNAPGKAILAHLPAERVDEIVDRHGLPSVTENSIDDYNALLSELQTVRDQGYAVDKGEATIGVSGIGATVKNRESDKVLGAIGLYQPTGEADVEAIENEYLDDLLRVTNTIEVNMLYE